MDLSTKSGPQGTVVVDGGLLEEAEGRTCPGTGNCNCDEVVGLVDGSFHAAPAPFHARGGATASRKATKPEKEQDRFC